MAHRSRYLRPHNPTPMRITARDQLVLGAVFTHRYLTSDHLRQLVFHESGVRACQARLRLLWENRYLDRYFTPIVLDGVRESRHQAARPIYSLAKSGAAIVAANRRVDISIVPYRAADKARGYATLEHHLVVTDVMSAVTAACRFRDDVALEFIEREEVIRRRIATWQRQNGRLTQYLVSDGAFALRRGRTHWAFHLEIVRADVPGGNRNLKLKMLKYVKLHRQGFLRRVLGHDPVRAVLFLTTSAVRAERMRQLAASLPYSRRLFWFGSYAKRNESGTPVTTIYADTILEREWLDGDGLAHRLVPIPRAKRPK